MDATTMLVSLLGIYVLAFVLSRIYEDKVDTIDTWCTCKILQWTERRQIRREIKDLANPHRVKRREEIHNKIRNTSFLAALILLPISGIVISFWQRSIGNEAWPIVLIAVIHGTLGVWGVVIKAALQIQKEEQQKNLK